MCKCINDIHNELLLKYSNASDITIQWGGSLLDNQTRTIITVEVATPESVNLGQILEVGVILPHSFCPFCGQAYEAEDI